MEKQTKTILLIGIIIALISISFVNAQITVTINNNGNINQNPPVPGDNWWGRFISSTYSIGTFSVYGDTLQCSKTPTGGTPIKFKSGQSATVTAGTDGSAFVDWFRGSPTDGAYPTHITDSRQFLKEDFVTKGSSVTFACDAGAYWNNDCYVDSYTCPNPCYSNSDCTSPQTCDKSVLSAKIPNAGVCMTSSPTHTTQVFSCNNGVKTPLGGVTYGDINFCTNPSDSKYLIGTTDQCLSSPPLICTTVPPIGNACVDGGGTCGGTLQRVCPTGQEPISLSGCGAALCCKVSQNESLPTGSACTNDIQCKSYHCDKSGFFSLEKTCQPTPWFEVKKFAASRDAISLMTTNDLINLACLSDKECVPIDSNHTATCINLGQLKKDGTLTSPNIIGDFFNKASDVISGGTSGFAAGAGLGATVCIAGTVISAMTIIGLPAAGTIALICTGLVGVGATVGTIAGANEAVSTNNNKDPLVMALKANDESSVGLCVSDSSGGGTFCSITKNFNWFKITDDPCTNGGIIMAIVILFAILLIGSLNK